MIHMHLARVRDLRPRPWWPRPVRLHYLLTIYTTVSYYYTIPAIPGDGHLHIWLCTHSNTYTIPAIHTICIALPVMTATCETKIIYTYIHIYISYIHIIIHIYTHIIIYIYIYIHIHTYIYVYINLRSVYCILYIVYCILYIVWWPRPVRVRSVYCTTHRYMCYQIITRPIISITILIVIMMIIMNIIIIVIIIITIIIRRRSAGKPRKNNYNYYTLYVLLCVHLSTQLNILSNR